MATAILSMFVGVQPAFADAALCSDYNWTACPVAGYTDHSYGSNSNTMYWHEFSGHNCTNYVAYVEIQNGFSSQTAYNPGNANQWKAYFTDPSRGFTYNGTPTIGAVAWWDAGYHGADSSGHVAYVEAVNTTNGTITSITISEDNWGGTFDWKTISVGSTYWPSGFIHLKDLNETNPADIFAINRRDAGSNSTAAHIVNGANWGQYLLNTGTALIQTDQTWDFALGDLNHDGHPDLWGFNRNPNGSNTAVHVLDGANLNHYLQAGNIVLPGVSQDWSFALGDLNHDGKPDIFAINRAPGTSHTEVRVINGANWGLYLQTGNIVLPATDSNWSFAVADYNRDGTPDIYAINRQDAGSNSTAVHVINGANWGLYLLNTGTALIQADQSWDFAVGDLNGDGTPDLWAFNHNTGGPNTVVHVLNGTNLSQYIQAGNIVLPATEANWSFRLGSYS